MSRGDIWTVAGGGDFAGRPRPAVIVQDDQFESLASTTVCMFTTNPIDTVVRVEVEPTAMNGLDSTSYVMVDKVTTVRKSRLGAQVGRLSEDDLQRLEQALLVFLGFAGSPRA